MVAEFGNVGVCGYEPLPAAATSRHFILNKPFVNCTTWEKREATPEEKQKRLIDAAINVAANFGSGGIDPNIRIPLDGFNELREAAGMPTIPAWEAPPRINKAELLVRAGWSRAICIKDAWVNPDHTGCMRTTDAAYAEMIRQADCR